MLEEVLCGRKICSEWYREARALLIDEVSNLVRIVLAYTFSRPETSVTVVEIDINKRNELTDGYLPGFVVKTSTRPQLKMMQATCCSETLMRCCRQSPTCITLSPTTHGYSLQSSSELLSRDSTLMNLTAW